MRSEALKDMRADQVRQQRLCERTLKEMVGDGREGTVEYLEWKHLLCRTRDVIAAIDRCVDVFGPDSTELDY